MTLVEDICRLLHVARLSFPSGDFCPCAPRTESEACARPILRKMKNATRRASVLVELLAPFLSAPSFVPSRCSWSNQSCCFRRSTSQSSMVSSTQVPSSLYKSRTISDPGFVALCLRRFPWSSYVRATFRSRTTVSSSSASAPSSVPL
jgi:hypothetical protein